MLQIVHDVAPGAKECFATADGGEVGFADNIRALADKSGPCGADVVVDDVTYFSEPFFSRGVIGDAADDVAAQGTHYFSSAGNDGEQQAYRAPLRLVAPDPATAAAGTNIKLNQVPRELYAGGFHDFDPGPGQDIAQSMTVGSPVDANGEPTGGLAIFDMQWDDPFDADGPKLGTALVDTTGEVTAANPRPRFTFNGQAGTTIRAIVDAIPSGTTDLILRLIAPDGTTLQDVDTGGSPEVVVQKLPVNGVYTLEVRGFNGATGDFTLKAQPVLGNTRTTTDLNALLFDENGNFLGALGDLNQLTGRPAEISAFLGAGPIQLVISKANTDGGSATQVAYLAFDDLQQTEWTQPLAPAIIGHPLARGATAVAAVDPFRPFAPEDFTSPGGDLPVFFDTDGNRLPQPDIRRVPQVAATDGGNTTFFVSDNVQDPDTQPNFFGTSAAAPHAAAIAALALQAAGGPGSLRPDAMRSLLQRSTFRHDLDPFHSDASDHGLTITADGAPGFEHSLTRPQDTSPGGMDDERFFTVRYSGRGSIVRLAFDGIGANPTGLTGRGLFDRGIVFDPRPFVGYPANFAPLAFWQQGFPFTVGAASPGIAPADVSATFSRPGVGLATAQQFQQMTLSFAPGKLTGGRSVSFGIDRDEAVTAFGDAEAGNSADQLGEGVLFPSGRVVGPGLLFTALTSDGRVIRGTLDNRVGEGFSPVDGYGYINAQEAVDRARDARSRGR
jgi:subtilase family protein